MGYETRMWVGTSQKERSHIMIPDDRPPCFIWERQSKRNSNRLEKVVCEGGKEVLVSRIKYGYVTIEACGLCPVGMVDLCKCGEEMGDLITQSHNAPKEGWERGYLRHQMTDRLEVKNSPIVFDDYQDPMYLVPLQEVLAALTAAKLKGNTYRRYSIALGMIVPLLETFKHETLFALFYGY